MSIKIHPPHGQHCGDCLGVGDIRELKGNGKNI